MAEVAVLQFARATREVTEAALPRYRSPFFFTQPTLLAVLCLMRYEEWTSRETEVRLKDHQELREVLGIERVPDNTTLYRRLRRMGEDDLIASFLKDGTEYAAERGQGGALCPNI